MIVGRKGADVSRETLERLSLLSDLVVRWSGAINLVARSTLDNIWERHVADSVQIFRAAPPCTTWTDLGSGAGFPGLVVAIIAAAEQPETAVTLIESDQRKCAFLRAAIRETDVSARVIAGRIEDTQPQQSEVVSARALADLDKLLGYCHRHLADDGVAILPKGLRWKSELEAARKRWSFQLEVIESSTEPGAAILSMREIQRV